MPLFKIVNYFIKKLEDKGEIISIAKGIIETIINNIHKSMYNLINFYDIIIPLTGALSSISDDLSNDEKNSLFNNNIINILCLYILTSPVPKTAKLIFQEVIGKYNEKDVIYIPDIDYKDNIFKKNLLKINSLDWYCCILFAHLEINFLCNKEKQVFENIFEQFKKIIKLTKKDPEQSNDFNNEKILSNIVLFVGIINNIYPENINEFKEFESIKKFSDFLSKISFASKDNFINFKYLLMLEIFYELKNLKLLKDENAFFKKFEELFADKEEYIQIKDIDEEAQKISKLNLESIYINNFKYYIKNNLSLSKEEIQLNELIDYKNQFHKLMKEQFMFNNLWSNKKLFFDNKTRKNQLKHKIKNYYTWNYQYIISFIRL